MLDDKVRISVKNFLLKELASFSENHLGRFTTCPTMQWLGARLRTEMILGNRPYLEKFVLRIVMRLGKIVS